MMKRLLSFVVGLTLTGLLLAGCETSVDPFVEENGQFSVYGFLSLTGEKHFIRVKDLNEPVTQGSTRALDATVTLENLKTGTAETLADSIVTFDGIATHNFRSEQEIQPKATYRLTVERPNGRASHATATMPLRTKVEVEPEDPVGCIESADYHFPNVSAPRFLEASVGVDVTGGKLRWVELGRPTVGPDGTLMYSFDLSLILQELLPRATLEEAGPPEDYCILVVDKKVRMAYTHFGPDWPLDSTFVDPLASDVESGLGVFGGLHRDTLVKTIDMDR